MNHAAVFNVQVKSEFIGFVRRRLFVKAECEWNGIVREITAKLELPGEKVYSEEVCMCLAEYYRNLAHWERLRMALLGRDVEVVK